MVLEVEAEIVELLQQLPDLVVMLDHAVGIDSRDLSSPLDPF